LEKEGFIKKDLKSLHKGRVITAKGKKFLDDVCSKNIQGRIGSIETPSPEEPVYSALAWYHN
jgi:ribosomal protein S19E (S16A)